MVNGALVDQWSASGINPAASLAAGDIDGTPGNEVVACGDGTLLWTAPYACYMPSIADIDGDGSVEVIVEGASSTARRGRSSTRSHPRSTPTSS